MQLGNRVVVVWPILPAAAILLVMICWVSGGTGSGRIHPVILRICWWSCWPVNCWSRTPCCSNLTYYSETFSRAANRRAPARAGAVEYSAQHSRAGRRSQ